MIKNNTWKCINKGCKSAVLEIESEVGIYSCSNCGELYINTKFKNIFNTNFKK